MASKKKQEEVKQEEAPQSKRKASSDKMTATKKEEPMVKAEKKSKQEKTPTLMEQYTSLKEKHPDAMLLFRKSDFYLTVNEDAKKSSEILGITLTKPSQKVNGEHQAMFPYHALDIYLPKLIRAGVRVAIVDDMSQAKDQKVSANAKETQEPKDKEKKEEQKELFSYNDLNGFIQSFLKIQGMYSSVEDFRVVFDELKMIEKTIDEINYTVDQISYYFACDLVSMTSSDLKPLKEILVMHKIIGPEDNVTLTEINEPGTDIGSICREWHFDDDITSRITKLVEQSDGYYKMWADGSIASRGNLMSICRVLQKGEEFALLEFYICD